MKTPLCPDHPEHGEMEHVVLMQGDIVLGCAWFCVLDDENKPDYCDGVRDCDCVDKDRVRQMELLP